MTGRLGHYETTKGVDTHHGVKAFNLSAKELCNASPIRSVIARRVSKTNPNIGIKPSIYLGEPFFATIALN